MDKKTYNQNDIIFQEGSLEPWMFSIVKGRVGIYIKYGTEGEKLLTELAAGRHFGEMGLFENLARSATAVALENDVELELISMDNIYPHFRNNPEALIEIMRSMSGRIRSLTRDYKDACDAIAEAREAAKKGAEKGSGLKSRLSRIMNDYIKPCFLAPSVNYDISSYMIGNAQDSGSIRSFRANSVIFLQGSASSCMYDLHRGSVGIYLDYGKENQKLLATLERGKCFGEMGIIDDAPRSATAIALEDNTEAEIITAAGFPAYAQQNPAKMLMILQHMSNRLRLLTDDYMDVCRTVSEGAEAESSSPDGRNFWLSPGIEKALAEYNRIMSQTSFPYN